jgi:hypothetical protein
MVTSVWLTNCKCGTDCWAEFAAKQNPRRGHLHHPMSAGVRNGVSADFPEHSLAHVRQRAKQCQTPFCLRADADHFFTT